VLRAALVQHHADQRVARPTPAVDSTNRPTSRHVRRFVTRQAPERLRLGATPSRVTRVSHITPARPIGLLLSKIFRIGLITC